MKVLLGHNYYQRPGGEDEAFHSDVELLRRHGHDVVVYTDDNGRIEHGGVSVALETIWSRRSYARLRQLISDTRPNVAHFHNTFPLISPSAYYACRAAGVPVIQTLHNYRIACPGATLFRDGHVCRDCVGRTFAWPGVLRGCYHHSKGASAAVALMSATHRTMGTWRHLVGCYIAPSQFARSQLIEAGLPADRVVVRPNFLDPDPGPGMHRGDYVLYAGRLATEKGLSTLIRACELVPHLRLKIVGEGPMADLVRAATARSNNIDWLGHQPRSQVREIVAEAQALVCPSESYETFGLVALEGMAAATPVIASDAGALPELVENRRTGLLFPAGDAHALADRLRWALEHPIEMKDMGVAARNVYLTRYAAHPAYQSLMAIYGSLRDLEAHPSRQAPGRAP